MLFGFAILATALLLSTVAAYYSVAGLVAIFSAATIPVIIMGGSLELGKIAATVWLHNNWRRAGWAFKLYLVPAVAFLMLLTSMGIFGYLSKAHSDQGLISGDSQAKIAIYDEKIRTERDNIDANRKALKQLDEAVDQVMGRSTTETGAERAVQIRRSQQAERGRLLKEIGESQKRITALNEERAPLAAEFRKVEAEVGPIKYIAALVYGDNPDANLLEKAVRFVIIMIVLVFDPLALALILAANKQFAWARQGRGGWDHDDAQYPPDDGALTDSQLQQVQTTAQEPEDSRTIWQKYPYLTQPFKHFENLKPMVWRPNSETPQAEQISEIAIPATTVAETTDVKAAMKAWKDQNPNKTLKEQKRKLRQGQIDELPWLQLAPDQLNVREPRSDFGTEFPIQAIKGDTFVRVDKLPNEVFKYNGQSWISVDKNQTDNYTYNEAYVDHLIGKIDSGEYDIELLSDNEREQIVNRLQNRNT